MVKKLLYFLLSVATILFISACENSKIDNPTTENAEEANMLSTSDTVMDEMIKFKYDKLISNVPIPFDILRSHESVPLVYNASSLNAISNLSNYSSAISKALNLGVYGGDLAYCVTYDKSEETSKYLECVKKLADDLGVSLAFDKSTLAYYQLYSNNKDSLEKMVFESYNEIDKTLKSNERIGLASLVIVGGWIEGLYVTLSTLPEDAKSDNQKILFRKILDQYNYLNMIIELLSQFKRDDVYAIHLNNLIEIKKIYEQLYIKQVITSNDLAPLLLKVNETREKIISH